MTPTPDQIASMEARGWTWMAGIDTFSANVVIHVMYGDAHRFGASVWWTERHGWKANYGWTGASFAKNDAHPTPEAAADEAESWLRSVLAGFRFPWLTIK